MLKFTVQQYVFVVQSEFEVVSQPEPLLEWRHSASCHCHFYTGLGDKKSLDQNVLSWSEWVATFSIQYWSPAARLSFFFLFFGKVGKTISNGDDDVKFLRRIPGILWTWTVGWKMAECSLTKMNNNWSLSSHMYSGCEKEDFLRDCSGI